MPSQTVVDMVSHALFCTSTHIASTDRVASHVLSQSCAHDSLYSLMSSCYASFESAVIGLQATPCQRLLQASQLHAPLFARLLISSLQIAVTMLSQVSKYDDPQEAAIAIVVEAYRLWLQYEVRTDDITIIVARVEGLKEGSALMNKQSMRYNMIRTCKLLHLCWYSNFWWPLAVVLYLVKSILASWHTKACVHFFQTNQQHFG